MSKKIKNTTLKTPLYGNCRVQNPEGTHIFNCGTKKSNWYLKRKLADVIQEAPLIIRLKFTPNGFGHANDNFYLQERQNICVCCGSNSQLTKHHVVPLCYRRFFPEALKNHSAHDILPLCIACHEKYETFADKFKSALLIEFNIDKLSNAMAVNVEHKKVCLYASALLRYKDTIPDKRYNKMMDVIRKYYGRNEITSDDLNKASTIEYNTLRPDYIPEGKLVVDAITDIEAFVKRWRQHFVVSMEPNHMPQYWSVDRPIDRVAIKA